MAIQHSEHLFRIESIVIYLAMLVQRAVLFPRVLASYQHTEASAESDTLGRPGCRHAVESRPSSCCGNGSAAETRQADP